MAGFRHEEVRKATEMRIKEFITEMIYIGFLVLFGMNFTTSSNTERFVILIVVEVTFIGTKIYCKAKQEGNKQFYKKGDKKDEKKN